MDSILHIDFTENEGLGLNLRPLPIIKPQKRKRQAKSSIHIKKICGADTETIDGRVWLFSTEFGVWEIETFADLLKVLYNRNHASKWTSGRGDGRKGKRGYSTKEFFFWNLQFDAQAIMHLLDPDLLPSLLEANKITFTVDMPVVGTITIEMKYLEGKYLEIKPKDWKIGQYKVGVCKWWDISQFYGKKRLNTAAKEFLGKGKIERCFDGSVLDVTRLGESEYRETYREDIEKYAIVDARLAGELTRLKREQYISQGIRFIQPYSLANVAQRALMDTCTVPTINAFLTYPKDRLLLQRSLTAYAGGWFETRGSGYWPKVEAVDLASAYPFVMYHLADQSSGAWVSGTGIEGWDNWINKRRYAQMGFCEIFMVFEAGLKWNPLVKKSHTGTLVAPQVVKGWFTAEEIIEARKWPHSTLVVGNWVYHDEQGDETRPFAPFIEQFYEIKMNTPKGTTAYDVSKVMLNSIYGKLIQAVDDKAGKMWSAPYAATTTGATRARLAELIRVNGYSALSVATDGVVFPADKFHTMPDRPAPAPYNLGEWEPDGDGELLVAMSGVYSIRKPDYVKTTFRGSASYFLRGYREGGLFRFCEENSDLDRKSMIVNKPYSAREAMIRSDSTLINVFEDRTFTISAKGDSTKRLWSGITPTTFGSLLTDWFESNPHRQVELERD